jgi:uncharacterized protein
MNPFQVLIKPASGDCNLACEYCFYRDAVSLYPDGRRRMSRERAEGLIREMLSYRFPETIFSWQGGEPTLMGLDFFSHVVECQMHLGRPGQVVGNALQTNGLLLDREWARFLARYRFLVGLSLDGPQELHDRYRRSVGGAGSFDRVMAAADLLASEGVAFNILSVVSRAGQDRATEIYRFFRSQGLDHLHFIPCLETDPATGRIADFSATPEGLTRFFSELFELQRAEGLMAVSERNLDAFFQLRMKGKAGLCTLDGACGDYLVVEHNGDIFPCDFFVGTSWRLGNLDEGRLADFFEHPLMKRFREARSLVPRECQVCDLGRSCRGGCLKDRLPNRAAATGKSHFCEAIRKLHELTRPSPEASVRQIDPARPAVHFRGRTAQAGRNAPCPCGSGLKYKRCCLPKG